MTEPSHSLSRSTSRGTQPRQPRRRRSYGSLFSSSAPLAEESIARDIEDENDLDATADAVDPSSNEPFEADLTSTISRATLHQAGLGYALASSYARPSYIATGASRSTFLPAVNTKDTEYVTENEQEAIREEEESLLRDNKIIAPKQSRRRSTATSISSSGQKAPTGIFSALRRRSTKLDEEALEEEEEPQQNRERSSITEQTPLIAELIDGDPGALLGDGESPEEIQQKWEDAIAAGKISTSWQRETKVIGRYCRSLILTFLLQYSLTVCSVFTVGHLGTIELGAVSLASMTANITGYAFFQGLATSLDTLCAQAYGSGHKKLVGLQTQRMVLFLWVVFIPVAIIWLSSEQILNAIVPEKETARLASLYLKIILIGTPGFAAFEAGKRFVQAQGLFAANLYILLIIAPLNAFMHWFFVWYIGLGFIGAPISVCITETLLPLSLVVYVRFFGGLDCWGGFSRAAFRNWVPMVKLALPGLIMTLAEYLAFEILTLSASWLSPTHLAAQSVLSTMCILTYQIPFPISIAASTRIANLIGATLADAAKTAAKVAVWLAVFVGLINMILLSSLRFYIPRLFTNDEDVIEMVANVLPVCAAFQLFDSLSAVCNGILRGIGRQDIGGYVSLICYYGCALPISFGLGFGVHLGLYGLWAGPAIGVALVGIIEAFFIRRTSWQKAVDTAQERNAAG